MPILGNIILCSFVLSYTVDCDVQLVFPDTLEEKYGKIIHVSAIFRHGDRSPYVFYPTDPYRSYSWPNGVGQLTETGVRKSYDLGNWFRHRYSGLLEMIPSHRYIRMDSSDVDRSIISAQAFLASFYIPKNVTQQFIDKLQWRPLPVHTIPNEHDNMLYQTAKCSALEYCRKKFFQGSKMKKTFNDHRKTIKHVQKHTKSIISKNNIFYAAWTLYEIWDALSIEKEEFNLTLPKWTNKIFPGPLTNTVYSFLYKEMDKVKIQRFMAGPFIKSLSSDVIARSEKLNSTNYFHFYFAHDQTIASIMKSFKVYNDINPPYLASLIFELRKKGHQNYVTVWYKNSTISSPILLGLPKCDSSYGCELRRFLKITRPLTPTDWKYECSLQNATENNTRNTGTSGH